MSYKQPKVLLSTLNASNVMKTEKSIGKTLLASGRAGFILAIAAHAYLVAYHLDHGLMGKLVGASIFPVGLMAILFLGSQLFTGNNLMMYSVLDHQIKIPAMLKNWVIVLVGNLIGAIIGILLLKYAGLYEGGMTETLFSVADAKLSLTFTQAFFKGILCNILVVCAVLFFFATDSFLGKIFGIWFPIMLFVFSGFEHSIANLAILPLAKLQGFDVTWLGMITKNIIPVVLGNIVGGAIVIPFGLYFSNKN